MFSNLPLAPPDAILGLTEAFKQDPNPRKINLSAGIYKDEQGNTPILACVKEAERQLLASEKSKGYLSIEGHADFAARVSPRAINKRYPSRIRDRASMNPTRSSKRW